MHYLYYIVLTLVIICIILNIVNLYYILKLQEKEKYIGDSNDVFSKGAKTGIFSYKAASSDTLSSQLCKMPDDYAAEYIPYCETLPDLGSKTKCYFQCIGSFPGGVRGQCYPNILKTYNVYSKQFAKPYFPQISPARCDQFDPCCFDPTALKTQLGLFDYINYSL